MSDDKKQDKSKEAPKAKPADEKRSPDEWMARLKRYQLGPKTGRITRAKIPSWQHSAASVRCGWVQHAHDAGEPFKLSQAAYEAALKAVEAPPYQPPKEAISPHCKL